MSKLVVAENSKSKEILERLLDLPNDVLRSKLSIVKKAKKKAR